ncbi:MAG: hypothetical protein K8R25_01430 [Methanosarcinales archaeon]|nr:hypothetical protein [Methanosarcinales archaeon]
MSFHIPVIRHKYSCTSMTSQDHENVVSRENFNLYRQHHAQSSNNHRLTYRQDLLDDDINLSCLKKSGASTGLEVGQYDVGIGKCGEGIGIKCDFPHRSACLKGYVLFELDKSQQIYRFR